MSEQTELNKKLVHSLIRDFMATMIAAGIHSCARCGRDDTGAVASVAFDQADQLLVRSKTPDLIAQLKEV